MRKLILITTETISIALVRMLSSWIFKAKSITEVKLNPNAGYIIVANHSGSIDPFIITANLPLPYIKAMLPFRFMTANKFFNKVWLWPALFWHGCYPARKTSGRLKDISGLEYTAKLVNSKTTIMIFPEGRVSRKDRQFPPKRGVEILARTPDVLLIPVRVKWDRSKGFWKSYSMAIGEPFSGENMTAEQIMDVVYGLKFR